METEPISRDLLAPDPADAESAGERWKRRAVSIPVMLGATVLAIGSAPVVAPVLGVFDRLTGRPEHPKLRLHGVLLQYLVNDSVEIVLSPVLWAMAGFGRRLDGERSRRRHAKLQTWSLDLLERRCEQLLGLRLDVEGVDALDPTPFIMISRHVSLLDASLPALITARSPSGDRPNIRGVIMREMLSDPGFDLLYGRLGSVFVDRNDGDRARADISGLGESLADDSIAAIFPEGRLFSERRRDRTLANLADAGDRMSVERAERLAGLRHLLPPKLGGLAALLDALPDVDVVVLRHVGFETVPSIKRLADKAPLDHAITIEAVRIPRGEIPDDAADRVVWLDELWLELDNWVHHRLT